MPFGHVQSGASSGDPPVNQERALGISWGRLGQTQLTLSYTVLFALAIVGVIVFYASRQPGNEDLPEAALWGILFWVSGWLMQATTYYWVARMVGRRMSCVSIGLLGVETTGIRWPARNALIVSLATLCSLLLLGGFYRLVEGGFQLPVMWQASESLWKLPSLGLGKLDSIWQTATWLCFIQAIAQMYPLPRSLGRQIVAAMLSLCGKRLDSLSLSVLFRRVLDAIAMITLGFAIWLLVEGRSVLGAEWPFFLVLSLLLWISTRSGDSVDTMDRLRSPMDSPSPRDIFQDLRQAIRRQRDKRRLKRAHRIEHGEAVDAARLDEILNRLHSHGIDALNTADRRILDRVSENLRRQRQGNIAEIDDTV